MAGPLLETKFHVPSIVGSLVPRARLSQRLRDGVGAGLTLVSAPAGFGKTTLMAELASSSGMPVAWLSLDPGDNDPTTFWTYVIGALERASPGVGESAQAALNGLPGAPELATATLVNALAAGPGELILVLDDFHVVDSTAIREQFSRFLDHLPATVHVVIGTRADPAIPLARLRARGALTEVRVADLRFTGEEAAQYLNAAMGLHLTETDVATLEARTEGWIAALQLAALSLRGRSDPGAFIRAFAGDDRYIVDYLVEEVLRLQTDEVRDFLLKTSILTRMTGPLVDAVTGQQGGRLTLEALDRGNLFLIALDDQRRWYRYHHLFAGVVRAHLQAERPDQLAELHRRASDWFERDGDRSEAIRHALEGHDFGRAADLVELEAPAMSRMRREPVVRRWADTLPEDVIRMRPVLSTVYAGTLLSAEETVGVDRLLTQAEAWLAMPAEARIAAGMVVLDQQAFRHLPAAVELFRAALAKASGDLVGSLAHARRVLEIVDESDHERRGGATAFLGLAHWGAGDLEDGYRRFSEGMDDLEKVGRIADVAGGAMVLADIRLAQGRLGDMLRLYKEGLRRATAGDVPLRGASDMHVGLGEVAYERGDLAGAAAHLREGLRLGDELGFPRHPYRRRVLEARLRHAAGDIDGAVQLLDEAEQVYVSDFSPDVRPIAALRARLQLAHGRLDGPRAWAASRNLTASAEVSYLHEYELTTYARLLVGEVQASREADTLGDAIDLTSRLLRAATDGRRNGSRIQIFAVRALALHQSGDTVGALATVVEAVQLAEPEGHVRAFLDEGPTMEAILRAAARERGAPAYLQRLLQGSSVPIPPAAGRQALAEPLSERELEVLRLLQGDLDGPELANHLFVSVNTLRTHTKNIYAKLGVRSRRAAVRRAAELGLLPRGSDGGLSG